MSEIKKEKIKEKINHFTEVYGTIPDPIKTKTVTSAFAAAAGLVISILVAIFIKSIVAVVPFVGLFFFGLFMFIYPIYCYDKEKIIQLEGDCTAIELSPVKSTAQKVYFSHNDQMVCVRMKEKYKKVQKGDHIVVYLVDTTPLYENNSVFVVNNYLAAKITSTSNNVEEDNKTGVFQFQKQK